MHLHMHVYFLIINLYCTYALLQLEPSFIVMFRRLDSLVGLFGTGCQPSSSNDPFGLRRISYGLVRFSCIKSSLNHIDDIGIMLSLSGVGSSVG